MPTSPRQNWPYPEENQDPFFDQFQAMVEAQDASVFALREDRDIFIMGGGTVEFTLSSGLLSWSAPIELNSAPTGFKWTLPTGSVNLSSGDYIYVTLPHNPLSGINIAASVASHLPTENPDNTFVLGLRNGDRLYFRDGKVLLDGQSIQLFATMPGGGGGGGGNIGAPGESLRQAIAMAVNDENSSGTPKVMGAFQIHPGDYELDNTTTTYEFTAVAAVNAELVTGEVELFDLTANQSITTLYFDSVATVSQGVNLAPFADDSHIYEIRGRTSSEVSGTIFVYWAGIKIANTIIN